MAKTNVKSNVGTKTVEKKDDVHSRLQEAFNREQESKFDIAILVHEALTEREENGKFAHENHGYAEFKDYMLKEFALEYRNTMYYNQIGEVITKTGLDKSKVAEAGWSKFKEISKLFYSGMTATDIDKVLKATSKLTVSAVRDFVESQRSSVEGGERQTKSKMMFSFINDQIANIKDALNKAMETFGFDNESLALEAICVEWMQLSNEENVDEVKAEMKKSIKAYEAEKKAKEEAKPRKERVDKGDIATKKGKAKKEEAPAPKKGKTAVPEAPSAKAKKKK